MKAAFTPRYGPSSVIETRSIPTPTVANDEVLVQIRATPVTVGDRRMRAGDFPGISALPGRLMMGIFGPRHAVLGTMFAGRVVDVGRAVTEYSIGDDVFGSVLHGAYAEYLAVPADAPMMAKIPVGIGYDEAADVPYGGVTALQFLRDLGEVGEGDKVLILGASGGVGRYAVQLAKHMGAEVTGVASRRNLPLVLELGADHVIDYTTEDFTRNGEKYDVIFDIAGATTFAKSRASLTDHGRYLTLFISLRVLGEMAVTSFSSGPQAKFGIAMGSREMLIELRDYLATGVIRPLVAQRFPLERIADAHAAAESGLQGAVMVTMDPATPDQLQSSSGPMPDRAREAWASAPGVRTGRVPWYSAFLSMFRRSVATGFLRTSQAPS